MARLSAQKRGVAVVIGLLLLVLVVPMLLDPVPTGPSVESRASDGFLGARLVLEEWQTEVELIDAGARVEQDGDPLEDDDAANSQPVEPKRRQDLTEIAADRALLLAFPAGRSVLPLATQLDQRLRDGGRALLTYSGAPLAIEEIQFFAELGVAMTPSTNRGSILPWRWWQRQRGGERHALIGAAADQAGPVLRNTDQTNTDNSFVVADALNSLPMVGAQCEPVTVARRLGSERLGSVSSAAPSEAETENTDAPRSSSGAEQAAVMRCRLGDGIFWLAPTSSLQNDRLAHSDNLSVLWRIRQEFGSQWSVVEGGAVTPTAAAAENARSARSTLNMMAWQLALLYFGAVLALAWSFGPRWREGVHPPDGQRSFLVGLGALHQKLGQFDSAARLLRDRWLDYDPMARRRGLEDAPPPDGLDADQLVEWAATRSRITSDSRSQS